MAYLILVRHGKSTWNELGLWTGQTDVDLIDVGREEARRAGEALRDLVIDHVHVSGLRRTHQTAEELLAAHGTDTTPEKHEALNERHYGVHTGKNKWEVKEAVGDEEFQNLRRSWDHPVPEGETLKDVHARVVPHYEEHIKPRIAEGKNVVVVAHGNSLRALVKHLEDLGDDAIGDVEIGTGEVHCYIFDADGALSGKEVRSANENKKAV